MAFSRDLRLEKAQSLLRGSTLGITEIALATGFASAAHFCPAYARRHGSPPSRLRSLASRPFLAPPVTIRDGR